MIEILGITKTWYGGANKVYPEQIQVSRAGKRVKLPNLTMEPFCVTMWHQMARLIISLTKSFILRFMLESLLNICKLFDYDTFIKGLFVYNRTIPDFLYSVDNGGSI